MLYLFSCTPQVGIWSRRKKSHWTHEGCETVRIRRDQQVVSQNSHHRFVWNITNFPTKKKRSYLLFLVKMLTLLFPASAWRKEGKLCGGFMLSLPAMEASRLLTHFGRAKIWGCSRSRRIFVQVDIWLSLLQCVYKTHEKEYLKMHCGGRSWSIGYCSFDYLSFSFVFLEYFVTCQET